MGDEGIGIDPLTNAEVLPPLKGWTVLGWGILASGLVVGMGLAIALKVNIRVRSPGILRPEQPIQVVQAGVDGTIARIDVTENERVEAGQAIASFQDAALPMLENQYAQAQTAWDATRMNQDVITAQLDALQYTIVSEAQAVDPSPLPDALPDALEIALARLVAQRPAQGNRRLEDYRRLQQVLQENQQTLQRQQATLAVLTQQRQQRQLLAPTDGIVFQLNLQNPGQRVQQGMVVARIVPAHSGLVVQAEVSPRDMGRVEVGQQAQVRVAAYPYPEYGSLTGRVGAIAPDVRPCDQPHCPSPTTYQVTIELDHEMLRRGDRTYPLQPGMDVTVDIISRQERLLTLFLQKLRMTPVQ